MSRRGRQGWRSCAPRLRRHCDQLVACGTLPGAILLTTQLRVGFAAHLADRKFLVTWKDAGRPRRSQFYRPRSSNRSCRLERRVVRTLSPRRERLRQRMCVLIAGRARRRRDRRRSAWAEASGAPSSAEPGLRAAETRGSGCLPDPAVPAFGGGSGAGVLLDRQCRRLTAAAELAFCFDPPVPALDGGSGPGGLPVPG